MSHTPAPGTNPFGSGSIFYNSSNHIGSISAGQGLIGRSTDLERELGTPHELELSEIDLLRAEVKELRNRLEEQDQAISNLFQIINELRQNNSGQRVNQTTGYWEERCY